MERKDLNLLGLGAFAGMLITLPRLATWLTAPEGKKFDKDLYFNPRDAWGIPELQGGNSVLYVPKGGYAGAKCGEDTIDVWDNRPRPKKGWKGSAKVVINNIPTSCKVHESPKNHKVKGYTIKYEEG